MAGVRSVAVNTDLSMKDIELLQGEIGQLRTEVERLHQKLFRTYSRGAELKPKHEDLCSLTWPSLHCKLEPSPVLIDQWEDQEPDPGPLLSLKACKDEIHVQQEEQDQLLELFSGPRPPLHCKAELNPVLIKSEDAVGRKQNSLLALKQELCLVPECKPEPHLTPAEDLYCSIYKLEPEPLEMACPQAQSEDRPVLAAIRTCSVKLVDYRKALDVPEGEQDGDEGGEDLPDAVPAGMGSPSVWNGGNKSKVKREESKTNAEDLKSEGSDFLERPFCCSLCDRSFRLEFNLLKHLKLHSGEKPFLCMICGKQFTQLCNLTSHERVHSGERPFGCGECGKQFTQASKLKTHERIHTGEKPYACGTCEKTFSDSSTLSKHRRTHTGHRPYQCDTCGKAFGQSAHLVKHSRLHNHHRKSMYHSHGLILI